MKVGAVILAAGKSERMGQNKLLLQINDENLITSVLNALATSKLDEKVIVLGHDCQRTIEAVKPRLETVKVVINQDYEQGMTSSLQKGIGALRDVEAAFVILGDQPFVDKKLLMIMVNSLEDNLGKALIVSPIHKGKKGHPLLLHASLFPEILTLKESETLRDIVRRHADSVILVEAGEWTLIDIDTPEDLARVRARMKHM